MEVGELQTFEKMYDLKANSFDILRLLFALMVVYSHCFATFYGPNTPSLLLKWTGGQVESGNLAVGGFFVLSGFLTTQSLLRSSSYWQYLVKRLLRIVPAFFVSLLLIAFLLGPLMTQMNLHDYFALNSPKSPYLFVLENLTFNIGGHYLWTPQDLFSTNIYPGNGSGSANGSMWTLKFEFACYLLLILLSFFYFLKHRRLLILFTIGFSILVFMSLQTHYNPLHLKLAHYWVLGNGEYNSFIEFAIYYIFGVLFYLYRENVYFSYRFVLLAVLILVIAIHFHFFKYAVYLVFPYLLLALGMKIRLPQFHQRFGDISYGMYIYAWPIQQTLEHMLRGKISFAAYMLLAYLLTMLLSVVSWKFIEKPALQFKVLLNRKKPESASQVV